MDVSPLNTRQFRNSHGRNKQGDDHVERERDQNRAMAQANLHVFVIPPCRQHDAFECTIVKRVFDVNLIEITLLDLAATGYGIGVRLDADAGEWT